MINDSLRNYMESVENGKTVKVGPVSAQWQKVKHLSLGAKIAVVEKIPNPKSEIEKGSNPLAQGGDQGLDHLSRDMFFDEIVSIKKVGREKVFDIEVEGTHNFVAGHYINLKTGKALTQEEEKALLNYKSQTTNKKQITNYNNQNDSGCSASRRITRMTGGQDGAASLSRHSGEDPAQPETTPEPVLNIGNCLEFDPKDIVFGGMVAHNTYISGNLGVGSSSPTNNFEVLGKAVIGSSYAQVAAAPTDGLLVQGNVGIGTVGPGSKLSVVGGVSIGSAASSPTNGLVVSGNVGVGTSSPSGNLHVVGQCVTGDTLLQRRRRRRRKDGTWEEYWEDVRIDQVQEGDEILTLNEETGEFVPQKVEKLMEMGIKQTFLLLTNKGKSIRTTAEHPYFVRPAGKEIQITGGVFQVDQSNRVEDLTADTFVALANENVHYILQITKKYKKELQLSYQREDKLKFFAPDVFAKAIGTLLRESPIEPAQIEIDDEYPGYSSRINQVIKAVKTEIIVTYKSLGHSARSFAHWAAYRTMRKEYVPTYKVAGENEEIKIDRGAPQGVGQDDVTLVPLNQIRAARDLMTNLYHTSPLLSIKNGSWKKVFDIKPGMEVATVNGWERVVAIKEFSREVVWDVQIEGTHNFVGNGIVAHNTYLQGSGTGTGFTLRTADSSGADKFAVLDNGNVGIGTTAPSTKLEINGTLKIGTMALGSTDTVLITSSNIVQYRTVDSRVWGSTLLDGSSLSVNRLAKVSDSNTLSDSTIYDNGNIGIGTTAPLVTLDVRGTLSSTSGGTTPSGSLWLGSAGSNMGLGFGNFNAASPYSWIQSRYSLSGTYYNLALQPDGGNVGIGTTGPGTKLHLFSASSGQATPTTNSLLTLENSGAAGLNILSGATSNGFIAFGDSGNAAQGQIIYDHNLDAMRFYVAGSDAVRITSSGNVGIGTVGPGSKLSVVGGVSIGSAANAPTNGLVVAGNVGIGASSPFGVFQVGEGGTPGLLVNSSNNIGIGTTAPGGKMEVYTSTTGSGSAATYYGVLSTSEVANTTAVNGLSKTNYGGYFYSNFNGTANSLSSEYIGVAGVAKSNSASQTQYLIGLDSTISNVSSGTINGAAAGLRVNNLTNGGTIVNTYGVYVGDITTGTQPGGIFSFYAADPNARNYFAGNVGIGTTSPGVYRLYLSGAEAYCDQTTCWNDASDINLKENIRPMEYGLSDVLKMDTHRFTYKKSGEEGFGFIAQEMEKIVPEIVSGVEGQKGIAYGSLTPVLVKAVQEQQASIIGLERSLLEIQGDSFTERDLNSYFLTLNSSLNVGIGQISEDLSSTKTTFNDRLIGLESRVDDLERSLLAKQGDSLVERVSDLEAKQASMSAEVSRLVESLSTLDSIISGLSNPSSEIAFKDPVSIENNEILRQTSSTRSLLAEQGDSSTSGDMQRSLLYSQGDSFTEPAPIYNSDLVVDSAKELVFAESSQTPGDSTRSLLAEQGDSLIQRSASIGYSKEGDYLAVKVGDTQTARFLRSGDVEINGALQSSSVSIAESYPTLDENLETGDVVSIRGPLAELGDPFGYHAAKSSTSGDENIVGVVTAKPGLVLGAGSFREDPCSDMQRSLLDSTCLGGKEVAVAVNGRTPVKVTAGNGEIKAGDFLRASGTPGYAEKATGAGMVVGIALEDYPKKGQGVDQTNKIIIAVNVSWWGGSDPAEGDRVEPYSSSGGTEGSTLLGSDPSTPDLELRVSSLTANGATSLADLTVAGNVLVAANLNLTDEGIETVTGDLNLQKLGRGKVNLFNGKIVFTPDGSLTLKGTVTADKVKANTLSVGKILVATESAELIGSDPITQGTGARGSDPIEASASAEGSTRGPLAEDPFKKEADPTIGSGKIPAGEFGVIINNNQVTANSKVFVTATSSTGGQALIVSEKAAGVGFVVEVETPVEKEIKFDWWIVN